VEIGDLPALNACLNGASALLLGLGYWAVRQTPKRITLHRRAMLSAVFVSALFLTSYLVYHYHHKATRFTHPGVWRTVYLGMLASHVLLATVQVPLVLRTLYLAFRGRFEAHRRIARWTWPIWLYVSVTGVLVYLFLYVWFPPGGAGP